MKRSHDATTFVRQTIRQAFAQSSSAYQKELKEAERCTGTQFAELRPIFVTGDPSRVKPRQYLLFVGLNPKFDSGTDATAQHREDLNRSADTNEAVTLGYFAKYEKLYGYFRRRARVVRGYVGDGRAEGDAAFLGSNALFVEAVPYTSAKAPGTCASVLRWLANVSRAHQILEHLLDEHPPAAVILDGRATHCLLLSDAPKPHELSPAGRRGPVVSLGRLVRKNLASKTVVARTPFIGSIGLNGNDQLAQLGRLIAKEVKRSLDA